MPKSKALARFVAGPKSMIFRGFARSAGHAGAMGRCSSATSWGGIATQLVKSASCGVERGNAGPGPYTMFGRSIGCLPGFQDAARCGPTWPVFMTCSRRHTVSSFMKKTISVQRCHRTLPRCALLILLVSMTFLWVSLPSEGQQLPELVLQNGHTDSVNSVAYSSDGKTFASGSSDSTVKIWEVSTGQLLRTLKGPASIPWRTARIQPELRCPQELDTMR